jgi:hypothetical protein
LRKVTGGGGLRLDRRELGELDTRLQTAGVLRVELPGTDLERRRRACGDGGPERLLVRAARMPTAETGSTRGARAR